MSFTEEQAKQRMISRANMDAIFRACLNMHELNPKLINGVSGLDWMLRRMVDNFE